MTDLSIMVCVCGRGEGGGVEWIGRCEYSTIWEAVDKLVECLYYEVGLTYLYVDGVDRSGTRGRMLRVSQGKSGRAEAEQWSIGRQN